MGSKKLIKLINRVEQDLDKLSKLAEEIDDTSPQYDIAGVIFSEISIIRRNGGDVGDIALQAGVSNSTLRRLSGDISAAKIETVSQILDTLGYDLCAVKR